MRDPDPPRAAAAPDDPVAGTAEPSPEESAPADPPRPGGTAPDEGTKIRLRRGRFLRLLAFFARAFSHVLLRDVFLRQIPVLRALRSDPLPRWVAIARRFRRLAIDRGGVLIKLGQYLSTRVDVLPLDVTRALSDLQDEVPAENFDAVAPSSKASSAAAARCLPGVHGESRWARRRSPRPTRRSWRIGTPVVVKVLRPDIDSLVETDLKASASRFVAVGVGRGRAGGGPRLAGRGVRHHHPPRTRHANEGEHAERFAR